MANNSSASSCDMNVSSTEDGDSWQETAILVMQHYVFLIIFIIGWINNSLAIAVLLTKYYRSTSTAFLMIVLACSDIGVVSISAAHIWIESLTGYNVRLYSSMGCKWHVLFTYMFGQLSAWSLALLSIERVVCVNNPLHVDTIFTLRKTVVAWMVIAFLLFGCNLHFLWTIELAYSEEDCMMYCDILQEINYPNFWTIWTIIDVILACGLPFSIILPCNAIIIVSLTQRNAWRRSSISSRVKISSTTLMLTIVSIAFVILTAPAAIEQVLFAYNTVDGYTADFISYLFHALFNLNSCLNFVLYCAFGSKFRKALVELWCKPSRSTTTTHTVTTRTNNDNTSITRQTQTQITNNDHRIGTLTEGVPNGTQSGIELQTVRTIYTNY